MTTRQRSQGGQATLDYVGALVVTALVVGVLVAAAPGFATQIVGAIERVVCTVAGLGSCGEPGPSPSSPRAATVDPELTPAQRQALLGDPAGAQGVLASLSAQERSWLDANDPQAAAAAGAAEAWKHKLGLVERYGSSSLDDFLAYRDSAGRDETLDWTSDGCSAPIIGGTFISFDFRDACSRHDYGYRNTKELGLFDERKGSIDRRFLQDMKDHCATRSFLLKADCYGWAHKFYAGVTVFG